jgi:hypothetical protein
MVFGDTCAIAPTSARGLQLQDPKKRKKYKAQLHDQLDYHNVQQKKLDLATLAETGQWTDDTIVSYQKLDKTITESMRCADKALLSKKSGKYMYSPTLAIAVQEVRYWRLRLKRVKGIYITDHQLQTTAAMAKLNGEVHQVLSRLDIVHHLRESRDKVELLKPNHYELRQSFLVERAEAILLH